MVKGMVFKSTLYTGFIQSAVYCCLQIELERPVLDVPRSNMVAEQAAKLMEELHSTCKTDKYLNSKFINSDSEI